MEILGQLAEFDESARTNLWRYVDRDLEREYAPKHRSKAAKFGPDALLELKISGERMTAQVREGGKAYRLDMTFPLFDLDNDYTLLLCSCNRDSISIEAQRCQHMYYFQARIRTALNTLAESQAIDPLAGLQRILAEDETDEDKWLRELRYRWVFDPMRFALHFELQTRARYEPNSEWSWEHNLTLAEWLKESGRRLPAEVPEQQVFDLLLEASGDGTALSDGHRKISLETGTWSFVIRETEDGLIVKPAFAEPQRRVEKRGVMVWYESTATLQLIALQSKEEQFLQYLERMDRPFPLAHRERVLELLGRMDSAVFGLAKGEDGPYFEARYQGILRLTPFKKGGMRVEIKLQLEPGLCLIPGQGGECISRLKGGGSWERDFRQERSLAEDLSERLLLARLPQPEPGVWIAFNDAKALECVAAIEREKDRADFIVEWPSFLSKKAYEIAAPLGTQNLKVSVGDKKDWLESAKVFR